MPVIGLGMFALGAPPAAMGLAAMAGSMYLMRFLTNGHTETTEEVYHHHLNISLPIFDIENN